MTSLRLETARDEALAVREGADTGPSLAAHALADDHVDRLLTDMEAVSETLRADDEDANSTGE